jgi:hypothetical protein
MSVVDIVAAELEAQGFAPMDAFASAVGIVDMLTEKGFAVVPVELLTELADDLEAEILSRGDGMRWVHREMEPVHRARTILAMIAAAKEEGV